MTKSLKLVAIAIFLWAAPVVANGQSSREEIEAQRLQVVKLRSQPDDRSAETSAGVYVGRDQENAYFVAALHALLKQRRGKDSDLVESVELQFRGRPTIFPARVLGHFDPERDLAVVYVPAVDLPGGIVPMPSAGVSAEIPIHIIGHPPAGDWAVWSGMVQNEDAAAGNSDFFSTTSNPSLAEGYSGGAIFDSHGSFVGMHTEGTITFGKALRATIILEELRSWQVPTTNIVRASPLEVQKLDLEIAARIKAAQEQVEKLSHTSWLNGKTNTGSGTALAFAGQNITGILYRLDNSGGATPEYERTNMPALLAKLANDLDPDGRRELQTVASIYEEVRDFCSSLPAYEDDDRRMTRLQVNAALNKLSRLLDGMLLPRWTHLSITSLGSAPAVTYERLPTVDQLLDKYVRALGGEAKIQAISTILFKGTLELPAISLTGSAESYVKAPNKFAFMIDFGGLVIRQGYDGVRGWSQDPQTGLHDLAQLELAQISRGAETCFWAVKLREIYRNLSVAGTDKVGDRNAFVVAATRPEGRFEKLYFDSETGLLIRSDLEVDTPQGRTPVQVYMEDYRDIDGVKVAFTRREVNPLIGFTFRASEVRFNVPVDDSKFRKPAQ
jgi:hypothetical protein